MLWQTFVTHSSIDRIIAVIFHRLQNKYYCNNKIVRILRNTHVKQKTIICLAATALVVFLSTPDRKLIESDDLILVIASIWALGSLFK